MSTDQIISRPISFNAPMVCAIINGKKTQTRRVAKSPSILVSKRLGEDVVLLCPYGKVGDRIWVREAWRGDSQMDEIPPREFSPGEPIQFEADGSLRQTGCIMMGVGKLRPGMFMPRWASRICLEITDVRLERLQDMSEQDAESEGLSCLSKDGQLFKYGITDNDGLPGSGNPGWLWQDWCVTPIKAFTELWNSINGKHQEKCWDANPLVWVVEFKVLSTTGEPN